MVDYQNACIVTSSFTFQEITLEKDSIWTLYNQYHEAEDDWQLYKDEQEVDIPIELVNQHVKKYWDYFQEKFAHLDKDKTYFGQLYSGHSFSIVENNNKVAYEKIDEYIDSNGKKYNAFVYPNAQYDNYFSIDDIENYANKKFVYFEPDVSVESYCLNYSKEKPFYPPKPIEVNEYFILYPRMLEVVDYGFRHELLTPELQKVFEEYDDYKSEEEGYWKHPDSMLITEVIPRVQEKIKEEEDAKIMQEINYEVEQFRKELIRVRMKR